MQNFLTGPVGWSSNLLYQPHISDLTVDVSGDVLLGVLFASLWCIFLFCFLLKVLEEVKVSKEMDRDTLISVARTSLRTKLHTELADLLTEVTIQNT